MNVDLDSIKIAKPCNQSWNEMTGDEQVRRCEACELCVFNISEMTRAEAVELIQSRSGTRTCIRLHRRTDGTVMTRDCPEGMPQPKASLRNLVRGTLVAGVAVVAAACTPTEDHGSHSTTGELQVGQVVEAKTVIGTPGPVVEPSVPVKMGEMIAPGPGPLEVEMGDVCIEMPPPVSPTKP